jgi:hypothetical protein
MLLEIEIRREVINKIVVNLASAQWMLSICN